MAMNISGLGNTYNGINTNSKQYKALKEKGWLSGIMQNEAMMSPEEKWYMKYSVEGTPLLRICWYKRMIRNEFDRYKKYWDWEM